MHFFEKKVLKNLRISEKSSTFAPAFESKALGAEKNRFLSAFEKQSSDLYRLYTTIPITGVPENFNFWGEREQGKNSYE